MLPSCSMMVARRWMALFLDESVVVGENWCGVLVLQARRFRRDEITNDTDIVVS
jgi:hypothetical protein